MADHGDEDIAGSEGAEGGQSGDDLDYELVAEEETIDTSWESAEIHPTREYPRVAFSRRGEHPEPPQRIYLTNRKSPNPSRRVSPNPSRRVSPNPSRRVSPNPSREVQTEPVQDLEQEYVDQPSTSGTQDKKVKTPLKRRLSQRLKGMRLKGSRDESPTKEK